MNKDNTKLIEEWELKTDYERAKYYQKAKYLIKYKFISADVDDLAFLLFSKETSNL